NQNTSFELQHHPFWELDYDKSKYSYQYDSYIDYVIRYGNKPFFRAFLGQTDLSFRLNPVRIGVSTQNIIVGPSHYNPILVSANAAGLPHVYIQPQKPFATILGDMHI